MKRIDRSLSMLCVVVFAFIASCASSEVRPVDLFADDACSMCRMAISDPAFASEIISEEDEVLKFDDLGCMENYRREHATMRVKAIFVMDYETKTWLPYEQSVIVRTGLDTPMGSGKVAASGADRARQLSETHPPTSEPDSCCAVMGSK